MQNIGGLYAAFPLAYAVVLPALYAPLIAMLVGLVFRGVAFEFRWRAGRERFAWGWAFAGGSALAALCQSIALGALLQGIRVNGRAYAGGWFDLLTPFSVTTGATLMIGYALLGACWLVMKTTGDLQVERVASPLRAAWARWPSSALSACGRRSSIRYHESLVRFSGNLYTLPVPLAVASAAWLLFQGLRAGRELLPFAAALALFILSYVGLRMRRTSGLVRLMSEGGRRDRA
jgi:cytochrome d ubiquinol oxidase subunit II